MKPLGGPHHFTGVTADVKTNVDFWCRVMGLRFVKNTLNYETTFRYHTYFGDEDGNAGSVVTFLEFEEAPPGVPGDGDIHRLILRVASYDSLEFWMDRFIANDVFSELLRLDPTQPQSIVFHDPEGHEVELMVSDTKDAPAGGRRGRHPRRAPHPRHRGRALVHDASRRCCPSRSSWASAATATASSSTARSAAGAGTSRAPTGRPSNDGRVGVWHHIAYDAGDQKELQAARDEAAAGPLPWTAVFDHYFFDSCYTMTPGGRMEMCTTGPGFLIDEAYEDLGNRLCLSPRVEPLRAKLERERPLIVNPRPRGKGAKKKGGPSAARPSPTARPPSRRRSPSRRARHAGGLSNVLTVPSRI